MEEAEAEARGQRVAAQLLSWYNDEVATSMVAYAALGAGRRIHILDTTKVQVPLETATYEGRGVVKNDDGAALEVTNWRRGGRCWTMPV